MPDPGSVIAVVDDDPAFGELALDILGSEGHAATILAPRSDLMARLRTLRPRAIIIDWRLGEGQEAPTAEPVLRDLAEDRELRGIPVIVCSADMAALRETVPQLPDHLTLSTLEKPFAVDGFIAAVDDALRDSGATR